MEIISLYIMEIMSLYIMEIIYPYIIMKIISFYIKKIISLYIMETMSLLHQWRSSFSISWRSCLCYFNGDLVFLYHGLSFWHPALEPSHCNAFEDRDPYFHRWASDLRISCGDKCERGYQVSYASNGDVRDVLFSVRTWYLSTDLLSCYDVSDQGPFY